MNALDEEDEDWEEWEEELPFDDDERPFAPPGSLALAFLSTLPLFLAYEWARGWGDGRLRNTSELFLGRVFALFGPAEDALRWVALALGCAAALVHVRRSGWRLGHSVLRSWAEGLTGAVLLGPLVLVGLAGLGSSVESVALRSGPPPEVPGLERAALVFGASVWEELLFRVLLYSALFLVARRTLAFFGAGELVARWSAEALACVGSALLFAAAHLDVAVAPFGLGGEAYHSGLFAWRALAGLVLGVLFRWRGAAVAAWAHGLFNVGLLLGAGPAVFL